MIKLEKMETEELTCYRCGENVIRKDGALCSQCDEKEKIAQVEAALDGYRLDGYRAHGIDCRFQTVTVPVCPRV